MRRARRLVVAAPAAVAALLALARWLAQGADTLYTDFGKRFYVPDAALDWRLAPPGPLWLGLDLVGAIAAIALAIAGVCLVSYRRAPMPQWLRRGLWLGSALPVVVPVLAFASGGAPAGSRQTLPSASVAVPAFGVEGRLAGLPAGRYAVLDSPESAIIATLSAGGETFEARFSAVAGSWRADPSDLSQPMTAAISADTAAIDTGVDARSKHARDGYLLAAEHPELGFDLERVLAARSETDAQLAFRAAGSVQLMGRRHPVELTGTVRRLDVADRQRLAPGAPHAVFVDARFELAIADTALAADAGDFDRDRIPIAVKLILVHTQPETEEIAP